MGFMVGKAVVGGEVARVACAVAAVVAPGVVAVNAVIALSLTPTPVVSPTLTAHHTQLGSFTQSEELS